MIPLSQELLLLFLKTQKSCSKSVKHSRVPREGLPHLVLLPVAAEMGIAMTLLCPVPRPAGWMLLLDEEVASAGRQECLISSAEVAVTLPCVSSSSST